MDIKHECKFYKALYCLTTFYKLMVICFVESSHVVPNIMRTSSFTRGLAENGIYQLGTRYGHGIFPSLLWIFVTIGLIAAIMVKSTIVDISIIFLFRINLTCRNRPHLFFLQKSIFCGLIIKCTTVARNSISRLVYGNPFCNIGVTSLVLF